MTVVRQPMEIVEEEIAEIHQSMREEDARWASSPPMPLVSKSGEYLSSTENFRKLLGWESRPPKDKLQKRRILVSSGA